MLFFIRFCGLLNAIHRLRHYQHPLWPLQKLSEWICTRTSHRRYVSPAPQAKIQERLTPVSSDRLSIPLLLILLLRIALILLHAPPHSARAAPLPPYLPAAPDIFGFGSSTTAGSGRHLLPTRTSVILVYSLKDRGEGSLRNCIEYPAPRICIFTVGGEIVLESPLIISDAYLTIAGQTAPSPGITISHSTLKIKSHDILIQHLALRPGDCPLGTNPSERDAISLGSKTADVYNVVLDHLSATWAIDENVGIWYPTTHSITISNSIIAEGLHNSLHPKGPHSKGVLIGRGVQRVSILRSLLALNEERNPYIQGGTDTEFVNNVVYGWGNNGGWSLSNLSDYSNTPLPTIASFRSNNYVAAPWSHRGFFLFAKQLHTDSRIYWRDNSFTDGTTPLSRFKPSPSLTRVRTEHLPYSQIPSSHILSTSKVREHILRNAGTRPWDRDAIDTRIINHVRGRNGAIRDTGEPCPRHSVENPAQVIERTSRIPMPSNVSSTIERNGYTQLENWLHSIAAE